MNTFANPITGLNGVLIRKQIQSQGFVSGVSGWIIRQDGTAEFNSATFRGNVVITQSHDLLVYSTVAPTLNKLTVAIAGSAGNDGLGNSWQQGLSIWDGNGVLIGNWGTGGFELINNANAAQILIQATNSGNRSPRVYFKPNSTNSSVNGYIEANSVSTIDVLLVVGPTAIVGTDSKASIVGMQLQSGSATDAAQGQLFWQDNVPNSLSPLTWGGGGATLTGITRSVQPGTSNPALVETWHNLGLTAGFQALAGFGVPRYQFEGINGGRCRLSGIVQLVGAQTGGTVIATLPAGYRPISAKAIITASNLSGHTIAVETFQVQTNGNITLGQGGSNGNYVSLDGVTFELD